MHRGLLEAAVEVPARWLTTPDPDRLRAEFSGLPGVKARTRRRARRNHGEDMGISVIWRDYGGRFSWLKLATLLFALYPAAWLFVRIATHDLGGRPVTELIHGVGDWTIRFLLIALAVTPARAVFDWQRVLLLRRMLGVTAACYAVSHLFLYCVDEKFNLAIVVSEIVLRFYLTIGFVVLLTLLALAITSTDGWQKRLGRNWKRLHMLVYPASALALFHYYLQSKANVTLPVLFTGFWAWLMLWRLARAAVAGRRWSCCRCSRCWPLWRPRGSRRPGMAWPPA